MKKILLVCTVSFLLFCSACGFISNLPSSATPKLTPSVPPVQTGQLAAGSEAIKVEEVRATPPAGYDPAQLFIAGISIGESFEQISSKLQLTEMTEDQVKYQVLFDKEMLPEKLSFYTNKAGIIVVFSSDNRAVYVKVNKSGYMNHKGLEIGGILPAELLDAQGRAACRLVSGENVLSIKLGNEDNVIRQMELYGFYKTVWSEIQADIDGDKKADRVQLLGRANPISFERGEEIGASTVAALEIAIDIGGQKKLIHSWNQELYSNLPGLPFFSGAGDIDGDGKSELLLQIKTESLGELESGLPTYMYVLYKPSDGVIIELQKLNNPKKGEWDLGWRIEESAGKSALVNKMLRDESHSYLDTYCSVSNGKITQIRRESTNIRS